MGRSFADGDLVAGRYRVVRAVASGAMGDVYEVVDLELREHVALKTLLAELAGEPRASDRLRREVQLARRITHPNVCRLFDVGTAEAGDATLTFLTMELLAGDTLADRLARGRLTLPEAATVVAQLAAGLDAVHAAGVVHRDLKSENIVLCDGGGRAVIADFGIARGGNGRANPAADPFADKVTLHGEFIGSPQYMAPEQVLGEVAVTPAADIYALGVLMYEMVTGELPFRGGATAYATASLRLTQAPRPPRQLVPELPERWERAILRCLERAPTARFATAGAAAAAIAEPGPLSRAATPPARGRGRPGVVLLAAVVAGGAAVGAYAWTQRGHGAGASFARVPAHGARRTVAIHAFTETKRVEYQADRTTAPALRGPDVALALPEQLRARLAIGDELRVLPPGADGKYEDVDDTVTAALDGRDLELAVIDSAGDSAHETFDRDADPDDVAAWLRDQLGAPPATALDRARLGDVLPELAAGEARGERALRAGRWSDAERELVEVVAADRAAPLAHLALARALAHLGKDAAAADQATIADQLAWSLGRHDQLGAAQAAADLRGELPRALTLARQLWDAYPDELEWGLALADLQARTGANRDADATVAALRHLAPPRRDDPRVDLADADVAENLGDFRRELDAARRAEGKLAESPLLGRAATDEAWALQQLGDLPGALAAYATVEHVARSYDDRLAFAGALANIATVDRHLGRLDDAARGYAGALATYEDAGATSRLWNAWNGAAIVEATRGDLARASDDFAKAGAAARATGDRVGELTAQLNIASLSEERGALADADALLATVVDGARALGDQRMLALGLDARGRVAEDRGALAEARRLLEQALAIREAIGDPAGAAVTRAALANVALDAGELADGLAAATAAVAALGTVADPAATAMANTALARAQRLSRHLRDARIAMDAAVATSKLADDKPTELAARLEDARLRAAEGHPSAKELAAVRAEAQALGLVQIADATKRTGQ
nr:serine/threonine-protein kinase [Kofleriaceae bacterium]